MSDPAVGRKWAGWRRVVAMAAASLGALAGLACAQGQQSTQAETAGDPQAIGLRIYREGLMPAGRPLQGVGQAGVMLTGKDAACATCHRRSGYGSSEGPVEVRPITGPALFGAVPVPAVGAPGPAGGAAHAGGVRANADLQPAGLSPAESARANAIALRAGRAAQFAGTRPRPNYDEAALARAINEGVDVTGRRMNPSMPRYAFDAATLASLGAYLKTLSVHASPGVTDDKVHFATVIQPGVSPAQRSALLEVLQTYIQDRNQGLRAEVRREETGVVRLRRNYREWVLHVWDLSGPSDTWARQLEDHDRAQPVLALVSGLGAASWRPIHDFSERFEVPCIFPQSDAPVLSETDFYTVYLSKGVTLEAQALAKFLLEDGGERGPLTQVWRRDDAGVAAASAFRQAWFEGGGTLLTERWLDEAPDAAFWQQLVRQAPGSTMVLWLGSQDLAQAQPLTDPASPVRTLYLSSNLNPGRPSGLAAEVGGRVRMVYPQELPTAREVRLRAARRWLQGKGIALIDEKLQMNAYLAATVTGLVVSHSMDTYSREFLLERMEHRLGTANEPSIYPRLSLGPGQRYASKGSYIVQVNGAEDRDLKALSDWIVP
jgi:hypothetical protein